VTKPFLWLFGDTIGPRLPSVLATAGVFGIVIWFARRRLSDNAAARAVLILATSVLFVALGRLLMTDPLLDLALVAAFLTFWESLVGDVRWRWVTAACLGLGVLAKGPVAILLFIPLAIWTFAREPELRATFKGGWIVGTLILALVIASWYLPAYLANGHIFIQKFLIEQNLQRFTGGDAAHTLGGLASLIFFVPVMLVGMAPWSVVLWRAWPRRSEAASGPLHRYLASWAAIVFLFFTISGAKLVHYVLPCFVPIALLVADHLTRIKPSFNLKPYFIGAACMAVFANVGFVVWYHVSHQEEVHGLARELKTLAGPGDPIVLYQLPRRQKSMGTGKPKIQETSEPSLLLYLNREVTEAESLNPLLVSRASFWILTRVNRLSNPDIDRLKGLGWTLQIQPTRTVQDQYALWRASR
jgi:4-amino-4-deoxy-L-arabinose transferase-like glycosyltransferase